MIMLDCRHIQLELWLVTWSPHFVNVSKTQSLHVRTYIRRIAGCNRSWVPCECPGSGERGPQLAQSFNMKREVDLPFQWPLGEYIYIYCIYIYVDIHIYIYIYTYICAHIHNTSKTSIFTWFHHSLRWAPSRWRRWRRCYVVVTAGLAAPGAPELPLLGDDRRF